MLGSGKTSRFLRIAVVATGGLLACAAADARRPDGVLELSVVDAETGQPIAGRLDLRDGRQRPASPGRTPEPWGAAPLGDHAYVDGTTTLGLRRGVYRFDLDAGPEYRTQHGHFEIVRHAEDTKLVEMRRFADLADEGWAAADLATCRPLEDLPLLHRAEQLPYTPTVAAQWIANKRGGGQWSPPELAQRRQRDKAPHGATALWDDPRGVVWLIDPQGSLAVEALPEPGDSSVALLRAAREGGWRVAAAATSVELPLWVAHDLVDAVVVLDGWAESPAGAEALKRGRPADRLRFPGQQGPGRWRRALYESLVEAGTRLPPVALSGSGMNTAPIGSSRVYAYVDDGATADADAWWRAAEDLATVVTNGPLLRPFVEGAPPGESFLLGADGKRTVSITLNLATRTQIDYLEIVKDGRIAHSVRLADFAAAGGRLPDVAFDAPGWLAVAAVAETPDRYEVALSAPWFVEDAQGGRTSAQAAAAWGDALQAAREAFGAGDTEAYNAAQAFWTQRTADATAP